MTIKNISISGFCLLYMMRKWCAELKMELKFVISWAQLDILVGQAHPKFCYYYCCCCLLQTIKLVNYKIIQVICRHFKLLTTYLGELQWNGTIFLFQELLTLGLYFQFRSLTSLKISTT